MSMSTDSAEPIFPPELEQEIFQTAAILHFSTIPRLMLVAHRVLTWVEGFLYREIILGRSFPRTPRAGSDALWTKDRGFQARAVRRVLLSSGFLDALGDDAQKLAGLTGTTHLAIAGGTAPAEGILPHISAMPLQRFAGHLLQALGINGISESGPEWPQKFIVLPMFRQLTHLDMFDTFEESPNVISLLQRLPALTHLATPRDDEGSLLLRSFRIILTECKRLEILVALGRPDTDVRFNEAEITDIRMPAKYSHVKKAAAAAGHTPKKSASKKTPTPIPAPLPLSPSTKLERAIARIILLRYEQDIARLFSTRLHSIALVHLPTFVLRCAAHGGPGWAAFNADTEEVKDFFRAAIGMDLRQAGERVATKSALWSYTALRHFAMSNNVPICKTRGLHSNRLLPHYDALKTHLEALEALPSPGFVKPPHLGSLQGGEDALEDACKAKFAAAWGADSDWEFKVRTGYEKLSQTLWRVAREFDVRGYGRMLRDKLTSKWCDCGCSSDHLGEVCEKTVQEDEEENGVRVGKQREWDGRGCGVSGWETDEEEDVWEMSLDFGAGGFGVDLPAAGEDADESWENEMTVGELMEWRFVKAEREKEEGNTAFRKNDFKAAVRHYEAAYEIESEVPHYQLNLAAAHLKLSNWIEADAACTKALSQHRSVKGYFRRAKARKMLGRTDEAIRDLKAILKLQPTNAEALSELMSLLPPVPTQAEADSTSSAQSCALGLGLGKPKKPKPPPFEKTRMDERRLRFVHVPTPTADPSSGLLGLGLGCTCQHHDHPHTHSAKGKGKLPPSADVTSARIAAAGIGSAHRREQEQALEAEMLRVLDAMKGGEGAGSLAVVVNIPGWDRYVVRRAE
ncbi:hypothetical protein HMN09_00468700 [Mycena chlorophos]|uniref:TPR-like protein n=1 Tax=Mycena chlorophos TaxID=658473 RepID=A0A8H6TEG0_MYCCL|nr:hypothetical protein HMN09_00468700 [Mycena chlorophos]